MSSPSYILGVRNKKTQKAFIFLSENGDAIKVVCPDGETKLLDPLLFSDIDDIPAQEFSGNQVKAYLAYLKAENVRLRSLPSAASEKSAKGDKKKKKKKRPKRRKRKSVWTVGSGWRPGYRMK